MDLDALRAARAGEWDRLAELSRTKRLSGAEADELISRYRAASADLADAKTSAGRTVLSDYLSTLLSNARARLTGAPDNVMRQIPRFFAVQLPAALYRLRWTTLAVAVAFLIIASTVAFWISSDPALIAALGNHDALRQYAENDFTEYYNPAASFAGMVWTNNAWISAQVIALGITGIYPVAALMQNAVGLGQAAAVLMEFDRGDVFLLHILPHGMLELTCIFVAVAAGLRIFWAWVAPGRQTRLESLAQAGRSLATVVVGLILALALSGVVEGFVTGQQSWPWAVKIAIGALALGIFLFYMLFFGRRAARAGESGDLTEHERGTPQLVAG